jgi:hypothetical protein
MNYYWLTISLAAYCIWVFQEDLTVFDALFPIALITFGYSFIFDKKRREDERRK